MTYRDAIREALRKCLLADPRVFLMGEDVGRYGGCFAVSKGLLAEFGPERIRDVAAEAGTLEPVEDLARFGYSDGGPA